MPHLDIHVPMRWSDLDGYKHVNNAAYLRILEEARIQAFWEPPAEQVAYGATAQPTAHSGIAPDAGLHTFVVSHRIEYMRQLGYRRDGVTVRLWVSKLGKASLDIDYEIVTADAPDSPYAKARTVIVVVDAETSRPARIPQTLREALEPWQGERLSFRP